MDSAIEVQMNPQSQPHGTTDDQIKEMESEGQAQAHATKENPTPENPTPKPAPPPNRPVK